MKRSRYVDLIELIQCQGQGNWWQGYDLCQESDQKPKRSLFNWLAQSIVQSTRAPGSIVIEASSYSPKLKDGRIEMKTSVCICGQPLSVLIPCPEEID